MSYLDFGHKDELARARKKPRHVLGLEAVSEIGALAAQARDAKRKMELYTQLEATPGTYPEDEAIITLYNLRGDLGGMIIKDDNGWLYSNQTNGTACSHPVVRGHYVPLPSELAAALVKAGDGIDWIDSMDRKTLDPLLEKYLPGWEFAEEYALASTEAWIWIKCVRTNLEERERFQSSFHDSWYKPKMKSMLGRIAVITYENSD